MNHNVAVDTFILYYYYYRELSLAHSSVTCRYRQLHRQHLSAGQSYHCFQPFYEFNREKINILIMSASSFDGIISILKS